jgi:hypothetical protein
MLRDGPRKGAGANISHHLYYGRTKGTMEGIQHMNNGSKMNRRQRNREWIRTMVGYTPWALPATAAGRMLVGRFRRMNGCAMDAVSRFRGMDGEWIRTVDALTDMRDAVGPTVAGRVC